MSLPSLGAWIETPDVRVADYIPRGRSLHWERGLKHYCANCNAKHEGRSLHWERGLKQSALLGRRSRRMSLPSLGAWIETVEFRLRKLFIFRRSLHWERGLKQRER